MQVLRGKALIVIADPVRDVTGPATPPHVESLIAALPDTGDPARRTLSLVNTRARLRMTTLYYFAALEPDLVVGTGNKVEDFGVGFFTKYGDGGVDVSPIADLTKSEIYTLGRALAVPGSSGSAGAYNA